MKNKKSALIILLSSIVVLIIVIAIFYKPAEKEDVAGTIANQEVIRQNIEIKNTLKQNQSQIRGIQAGLEYFNNYIAKFSGKIDIYTIQLKSKITEAEFEPYIAELDQFNKYLKYNSGVIIKTQTLLKEIENGKVSDSSFNIKDSLRQLDRFVVEIYKKDSILEKTIAKIYQYTADYSSVSTRKSQLDDLMKIAYDMSVAQVEYASVVKDETIINANQKNPKMNKQMQDSIKILQENLYKSLNPVQLAKFQSIIKSASNYNTGSLGILPLFDINNFKK